MPGTLLRAVIVEEFVIIVFPKRVFFLLAFLLFNIFDNTHRHSKFKSICFSITIKNLLKSQVLIQRKVIGRKRA